jgi:hypothetical protein
MFPNNPIPYQGPGPWQPGLNVLATANNPFSILKQLAYDYGQQQYALNEGLNKQNLWYSSERGRRLGELGRENQLRGYEAGRETQAQLGDILSALTAAKLDIQQQRSQAVLEAQQRRAQRVMQGF